MLFYSFTPDNQESVARLITQSKFFLSPENVAELDIVTKIYFEIDYDIIVNLYQRLKTGIEHIAKE